MEKEKQENPCQWVRLISLVDKTNIWLHIFRRACMLSLFCYMIFHYQNYLRTNRYLVQKRNTRLRVNPFVIVVGLCQKIKPLKYRGAKSSLSLSLSIYIIFLYIYVTVCIFSMMENFIVVINGMTMLVVV